METAPPSAAASRTPRSAGPAPRGAAGSASRPRPLGMVGFEAPEIGGFLGKNVPVGRGENREMWLKKNKFGEEYWIFVFGKVGGINMQ